MVRPRVLPLGPLSFPPRDEPSPEKLRETSIQEPSKKVVVENYHVAKANASRRSSPEITRSTTNRRIVRHYEIAEMPLSLRLE